MATYAIVDEDKRVTNLVEWDGVSPFSPPGILVQVREQDTVSIGDEHLGYDRFATPRPKKKAKPEPVKDEAK